MASEADTHHQPRGRSITLGDAPILTVGELRTLLDGVEDDVQVVLATDEWYVNVREVVVPGPNWELSEYSAVTIFPGVDVETRQF